MKKTTYGEKNLEGQDFDSVRFWVFIFCISLGIFTLLIFSHNAYIAENYLVAYFDTTTAIVLSVILFFIIKNPHSPLLYSVAIIISCLLFLFLLLSGSDGGITAIWSLLVPALVFSLLNFKLGLIISSAYFLLAVLALSMNSFYPGLFYDYPFAIYSRLGAMYLFLFSFGALKKYMIDKHEANLKIAKKQAEAANIAKGTFLANMSHEIRTPMGAILGMIELLKNTNPNDEQKEYFEIMQNSGTTLLTILNDVLDLSRIESGKYPIEKIRFQLPKLLEETVNIKRALASSKGLTLKTEFDPQLPLFVIGDPVRLRQILWNLLNNAIKFTEKGEVKLKAILIYENGEFQAGADLVEKNIKLKIKPGLKGNNDEFNFKTEINENNSDATLILFQVIDSGIGIAQNKMSLLFDAFTQVDSSTNRLYGGAGLGLSISKNLVELMNGQIGVDSIIGVGSSFWFTLPLLATGSEKLEDSSKDKPISEEEKSSDNRLKKYEVKLLLAEDNSTNQLVFKAIIEKIGGSVLVVENGAQAVEILESQNFDMVFLDLNMPVLNGFEAAKRIREMESEINSKDIPIIALTADGLSKTREKCLEFGMNDIMLKPYSIPELMQTLDNWLGKKDKDNNIAKENKKQQWL